MRHSQNTPQDKRGPLPSAQLTPPWIIQRSRSSEKEISPIPSPSNNHNRSFSAISRTIRPALTAHQSSIQHPNCERPMVNRIDRASLSIARHQHHSLGKTIRHGSDISLLLCTDDMQDKWEQILPITYSSLDLLADLEKALDIPESNLKEHAENQAPSGDQILKGSNQEKVMSPEIASPQVVDTHATVIHSEINDQFNDIAIDDLPNDFVGPDDTLAPMNFIQEPLSEVSVPTQLEEPASTIIVHQELDENKTPIFSTMHTETFNKQISDVSSIESASCIFHDQKENVLDQNNFISNASKPDMMSENANNVDTMGHYIQTNPDDQDKEGDLTKDSAEFDTQVLIPDEKVNADVPVSFSTKLDQVKAAPETENTQNTEPSEENLDHLHDNKSADSIYESGYDISPEPLLEGVLNIKDSQLIKEIREVIQSSNQSTSNGSESELETKEEEKEELRPQDQTMQFVSESESRLHNAPVAATETVETPNETDVSDKKSFLVENETTTDESTALRVDETTLSGTDYVPVNTVEALPAAVSEQNTQKNESATSPAFSFVNSIHEINYSQVINQPVLSTQIQKSVPQDTQTSTPQASLTAESPDSVPLGLLLSEGVEIAKVSESKIQEQEDAEDSVPIGSLITNSPENVILKQNHDITEDSLQEESQEDQEEDDKSQASDKAYLSHLKDAYLSSLHMQLIQKASRMVQKLENNEEDDEEDTVGGQRPMTGIMQSWMPQLNQKPNPDELRDTVRYRERDYSIKINDSSLSCADVAGKRYAKYFPIKFENLLSATTISGNTMVIFFAEERAGKGPKLRSAHLRFQDDEKAIQWALAVNSKVWKDNIQSILGKRALLLVNKRKTETLEIVQKYMIPVFECAGKGYNIQHVDERTCSGILNATLSSDSKNYDLVAYLSSDYSATVKAMLKNTVTQIMGYSHRINQLTDQDQAVDAVQCALRLLKESTTDTVINLLNVHIKRDKPVFSGILGKFSKKLSKPESPSKVGPSPDSLSKQSSNEFFDAKSHTSLGTRPSISIPLSQDFDQILRDTDVTPTIAQTKATDGLHGPSKLR